uniref:CW-type domain-containing protein n=1 Tax=Caenorhabditis tropicalis TaxID=1561998 RepID=A0A1I7TWL5_9PELO
MKTTQDAYLDLEKATVALNHLNSNSASHSDPFSAIAELVDNSYDAKSKNLHIDYVKRDNHHILEFLDDGEGMSHEEALKVIAFGHSEKDQKAIGRYGNGLKSGGFHLGRELLILTKKNGIRTVILISHQFHEDHNLLDSVFVPCPSINDKGEPVGTTKEIARFEMEMKIIHEYAPLGSLTLDDLFNRISSSSGTYIMISKLRRSTIGEFLINVTKNPHDFLIDGEDLMKHKTSLREYLQILYLYPVMKIHLRNVLVVPKKICENWIGKYEVDILNKYFKDAYTASAKERNDMEEECRKTVDSIKSQIGDLANRREEHSPYFMKARILNAKLERESQRLQNIIKETDQIKKDYRSGMVMMRCGVETMDRTNNGVHIYVNNRLVKWGYKKTFFKKSGDSSIGISAYLNLDSALFRPTTNKQGLECAKTFNILIKKCDEQLANYEKFLKGFRGNFLQTFNITCETNEEVTETFWKTLGYRSPLSATSGKDLIQNETVAKHLKKLTGIWYLCEQCRSWRVDNRQLAPAAVPGTDLCSSRSLECINPPGRSYPIDEYGFKYRVTPTFSFKKTNPPLPPRRISSPTPILSREEPTRRWKDVVREERTVDDVEAGPVLDNTEDTDMEEPPRRKDISVKQERRSEERHFPVESEDEEEEGAEPDNEVDPEMVEEDSVNQPQEEKEEPQGSRHKALRQARKTGRLSLRCGVAKPVVPAKRRKTESVRESNFRNREECLEHYLNLFLQKFGEEPVAKNEQREINVDEIFKNGFKISLAEIKRLKEMMKAVNKSCASLMTYLRQLENFPLIVAEQGQFSGIQMLQNLNKQIEKEIEEKDKQKPSTSGRSPMKREKNERLSTSGRGATSRREK